MDIKAEYQKILKDRLYFNEHYLRIRTQPPGATAPILQAFKYNPTQMLLDKAVQEQEDAGKPVRLVILKARQEGVSTYTEGYLFKKTILNKYVRSIVVAHDIKSSIGLFGMSQLFYECLPPGMRPMKRFSNRKELLFENPDEKRRPVQPGLRSHMYVGTANDLELGRSSTIQNAHLSELAVWPNPESTMLALMQTIPEAPGTSVFVESTANGWGDYFHGIYNRAKAGLGDFRGLFFPWFIDPKYRRNGPPLGKLDSYEIWLRDECGCDEDQLRWRRWAIVDKCGGDLDRFKQEYPATDDEAFLKSGRSVFDTSILSSMLSTVPPPKYTGEIVLKQPGNIYTFQPTESGYLKIWVPPKKDKTYVIGADVAEGVPGGNYSDAIVLCREDLEQVAEWHGHAPTDEYAEALANIGFFYNFAMIAFENTGIGAAITPILRNLYWNLFCTVKMDAVTRMISKKIGWSTNLTSRPLLIEGVSKVVRGKEVIINSKELIEELLQLIYVEVKNSPNRANRFRPEPPPGKFDDRVFAFGIAVQAHLQHPIQDPKANKNIRREMIEEELLSRPASNMQEREIKIMRRLKDTNAREMESDEYDEHFGIDF